MFQFEATLIPLTVQTDAGQVAAGEGEIPHSAVIQSFLTEVGPVRVVIPIESVQEVVDGLLKAKESAEEVKPKADIYIPKSDSEVQQVVQAHDNVTKGKL